MSQNVTALILKPRPDEVDQAVDKVRGRTASAFPIGRRHANTISALRRPLPSPPKVSIPVNSARPLPSSPKRARTQSASGSRPRNALDANIDAAHNTLVIRPPERSYARRHPTISPPPTTGLRLNTTFANSASSPSRINHTSKSRTLPLAPSQPNPNTIASPTVSSAASSSYSAPYNNPDSSSTPDTISTTASLATPDSLTPPSSSHSATVRSSVASRRMGLVSHVRIRSGSVDDDILPPLPHLPPPIDDDTKPSIPSHLKGKAKARPDNHHLRLSRSMDVHLDGYPTDQDDQAPTPAPTQMQYPSLSLQRPPQPHLLIPASTSGQKTHHPFGPDGLSPACSSDDYSPSPLAFAKSDYSTHGSSSLSPSPHHHHQQQYSERQSTPNNSNIPSAVHPEAPEAADDPIPQIPSPLGSSEGEDGGEHSHPAFLEDMISLAPSRKTRESGFFYPSGLSFSSSRKSAGSFGRGGRGFGLSGAADEERLQQQRWSISSLLPPPPIPSHRKEGSTGSSPIDTGYYDNSYSPGGDNGPSPVSPFSARPGSSNSEDAGGGVFNWAAVLSAGGARGRGAVRGGKAKARRRRRQSWGGRGSDLSSPISVTGVSKSRIGGGEREKSLSPIRYARRNESDIDEGEGAEGDVDDDYHQSDDELGIMEVEKEMEFAAADSDMDPEMDGGNDDDDGGLDVLGMPKERRRTGPRIRTRMGVHIRHRRKGLAGAFDPPIHSRHSSEEDLELTFAPPTITRGEAEDEGRKSRSRSRKGGFSSEDEPLPPLPSRFSVGQAKSHQMSAVGIGAFPSIQSKVLAGGRSSTTPPTTDYSSDMASPFGMGIVSTPSNTTPPPTAPASKGRFSKGILRKPPPRSKSFDPSIGSLPTPNTPSGSFRSFQHHHQRQSSVSGSMKNAPSTHSAQSMEGGGSRSSAEFAGSVGSHATNATSGSRGGTGKLPFGIAHLHSEAVGFMGER